MSKRLPTSSTPSSKGASRLSSIENYAPSRRRAKQSICVQTDTRPTQTTSTNTPSYLDEMLVQGQHMTDDQFEQFLKGKRTSECFVTGKDSLSTTRSFLSTLVLTKVLQLVCPANVSCSRCVRFTPIDRASDCYWTILAERARTKLDDCLRENRQVCDRYASIERGTRSLSPCIAA